MVEGCSVVYFEVTHQGNLEVVEEPVGEAEACDKRKDGTNERDSPSFFDAVEEMLHFLFEAEREPATRISGVVVKGIQKTTLDG